MTFYEEKLNQLKKSLYGNEGQIAAIIAIKNYINHNYTGDLKQDSLSERHCISKYHLLRLFKKYYGITPRQYLIDIRIAKSKSHLKAGMSVTKTCYAVGFESLGSFSTLFKQRTGITPFLYQKEQLSRSD